MWHDRWHSFLWVWVSASQRIPLFVLARNPHKGPTRKISFETGRRQGKVRSLGSQQKRAVNGSWRKVMVRERGLLSEKLGPVDPEAGLANVRGWVRIPGGCVGISLGYTLVIARCTEIHRKLSQTSLFLRLELTQVHACFFLLFFHPLGCVCCVLCVYKAMWNAPGWRWEKRLDNQMAMSWFRRLR